MAELTSLLIAGDKNFTGGDKPEYVRLMAGLIALAAVEGNLLASSYSLASDNRRMLAALTDSPGSWPSVGFEKVFTGTILPDSSFYALFCTWPAPELPRPGCVWSHVLLIELADLASINDLGELRQLFKRPKNNIGKKWSEPIEFSPSSGDCELPAASCKADIREVLHGLYGNPDEPAVVSAASAEIYEDVVFAIWSQQWPRLRRSFRFSTGSFADRSRGEVLFDLQVMPLSKGRNDTSSLLPAPLLPTQNLPTSDWIFATESDLTGAQHGLRNFMRANGAETATPDQGAQSSSETIEQSCPTVSSGNSTQLRIRLPAKHAARWLALPLKLREHVAGIVFGSFTAGVKLEELAAVASELRLARLSLNNVLQLTLLHDAPLDAKRIDAALDRINTILGERTP